MPQEIQLFAGKQIRTYWDDAEEKYYFCIIDSIEALTDSKDPAGYFKKLRQRDPELDAFVRGDKLYPPTNEELVMNMLAELTTTNITKEEHPITMGEHAQAASRGGSVARVAREAFEQQTGKKVVSDLSMKRFIESQQPQLDFAEDTTPEGPEDTNE